MDNNNNFENGFYGSAPQKPFTDKSSDVPVNPQTFSGEGESVNQTEQTAFDEQDLQNANTSTEQMQNVNYSNEPFGAENQTAPVQNTPEVHNAPQGAYRQNPDYAYPQHNDYSNPQYSARVNYQQNGMPVQNNYGGQNVNYGGCNPQYQYNPNPQNYNPNYQNNRNMPPQYNAYAPYPPMPPRPPKKKANAGLIALIVLICVLHVESMEEFFL